MANSPLRTVRTVGRAAALDLLLTGRHIDSAEALQLGLIHRSFANSAELAVAVDEFSTRLAAKAPLSVTAILRVVAGHADRLTEDAVACELQEFDKLSGTRDNIEGISALFEKRTPYFFRGVGR